MMKIISVSGQIGSGKSSVAQVLGRLLGREVVSTGSIQRRLARERGMTTLEFNLYSEQNLDQDDLIDRNLVALRDAAQEVVVDSRMAWFFLPESLKVFLIVDPIVGTQRVLRDGDRGATETYADQERASQEIRRRQESEKKRFFLKYNVDYALYANYDLVVDTSYVTAEEVAHLILSRSSGLRAHPEIWLCPKRLYPSQDIRDLSGARAEESEAGSPIGVLRIHENFFIYDGHERVSAAIQGGLPFVPARIVANQGEEIAPRLLVDEYVKNGCSLSALQDWEACHRFRFPGYPGECGSTKDGLFTAMD